MCVRSFWRMLRKYMNRIQPTPVVATDTLNILLKYKSDITKAEKELATNVPAAAGA